MLAETDQSRVTLRSPSSSEKYHEWLSSASAQKISLGEQGPGKGIFQANLHQGDIVISPAVAAGDSSASVLWDASTNATDESLPCCSWPSTPKTRKRRPRQTLLKHGGGLPGLISAALFGDLIDFVVKFGSPGPPLESRHSPRSAPWKGRSRSSIQSSICSPWCRRTGAASCTTSGTGSRSAGGMTLRAARSSWLRKSRSCPDSSSRALPAVYRMAPSMSARAA